VSFATKLGAPTWQPTVCAKQRPGAASIEWFDRWIKTGDPAIRQRILDYNEDDCRAMSEFVRDCEPATFQSA
jgi:predicted RecB family nuclease